MQRFCRSFVHSVAWLLVILMLVGTTGCGGCRNETPQQKQARLAKEAAEKKKREEEERKRREKEKKEKKKPPFEVFAPVTKPSDTNSQRSLAKRGHWMTVTQLMKSNKSDWGGDTTLQVTDTNGNSVPFDLTRFTLSSTRPVALAKGRPRQVENMFLVPSNGKSASVRCTLRERNYGSVVGGIPLGSPLSMMESYQYFFVVLAKNPNRYGFLKSYFTVEMPQSPRGFESENSKIAHYRLLQPDITKQIPLPDNPMCWTTIACILWDDVDPSQLDRQRREALVDWLHWGGQLVINGPDSLKLLEGSFLEPYLPATDGGVSEITQADVATMQEFWTTKKKDPRPVEPKPLEVLKDKPWSGIKLKLAEGVSDDEGLGAATGGLMVEGRVGRGRIVVSRMQLAQPALRNWSPHYDDLLNAGILRRPSRKWSRGEFDYLHVEWDGIPGRVRDSQYVTHHRLFSRDVHDQPDATNQRSEGGELEAKYVSDVPGGIGSWNNFNATSNAARAALREAAGVEVPPASFVVNCLAIYLVVLVPMNWLFFKALGRVEYAWIAAPIIALVGTAVVVKQAQLDIGFVRAQTEIALLETQSEYPRGHLSRYSAFYTSLSTSYVADFEDSNAVVAPFPRGKDASTLAARRDMELAQNKTAKLSGLQIDSASTDMLHSEQMVELDGPLRFERKTGTSGRVINQTQYDLQSVAVVKRNGSEMLGSWIGTLEQGRAITVSMVPTEGNTFKDERAKENSQGKERLDLEPLFDLALNRQHIADGEIRLVARVDKVLPGVTVSPSAAQVRGTTLVVAHLDHDALPLPVPDVNTPIGLVSENSGTEFDFGDDLFGTP